MNKTLILNILGVIVIVLTYVLDNHLAAQYAVYEGLALVVVNAIIQQINTAQITKLKAKIAKLSK